MGWASYSLLIEAQYWTIVDTRLRSHIIAVMFILAVWHYEISDTFNTMALSFTKAQDQNVSFLS